MVTEKCILHILCHGGYFRTVFHNKHIYNNFTMIKFDCSAYGSFIDIVWRCLFDTVAVAPSLSSCYTILFHSSFHMHFVSDLLCPTGCCTTLMQKNGKH